MKRILCVASTALVTSLATVSAYAQDAAAPAATEDAAVWRGIEDIVVTAQRRQETVQSVPIAVSAFSNDQLMRQGISNTLDLGRFVPNLITMNNTGAGTANAFYLRGLGNTESIPTFDPPVGTYVDDIYLSRQNANNINLFDVERVEVLRGPQGTLFGRNTTGGAVNVIMRDPGEEFGGYAEVGYGRYDKMMVRGSFDVPFTEKFAIKLSGYWQDDDGYVKNVTTNQRLNDEDGWGVRLGVRADFADNVRWRSSYARIAADAENILNYECNPANPSDCNGRFATTGLRSGSTSADSPFVDLGITGRKAYYLQGNRTDTDLATSDLSIDISEDLTLSFISGYVHQVQQYALDFYDGRTGATLSNPIPPVQGFPHGGFTVVNDGKHEQFTQEIKLNGTLFNGLVDFVGGGYYINEKNHTDFADVFTLGSGVPLLLADRLLYNKTEAYAGYLQADFHVTEQLTLTAGVRYTDETKTVRVTDNRASCNDGTVEANCLVNENLIAPSNKVIPTELETKKWTPRFAIDFKASDNVMLFASATRGFKSGGWNARSTAPNAFQPFGPETVWSYEAGVKSDLFDRRLRANITAFYVDVSDLQTPAGLVGPTGAITFITRNFASLENKGIEAEFTYMPTDRMSLYLNVGLQDAKYKIDHNAPDEDEYGIQSVAAQQRACQEALAAGLIPSGPGAATCGAGIVNAKGELSKPTRTPKVTLAVGASYEQPIGQNGMTLVPSVNLSYRSSQEVAASNFSIYSGSITGANGSFPSNPFSGEFITGSYSGEAWFVNASLALNGPEQKWQLALECTNCFNETAGNTSLANGYYLDPPMRWMVRARHNF